MGESLYQTSSPKASEPHVDAKVSDYGTWPFDLWGFSYWKITLIVGSVFGSLAAMTYYRNLEGLIRYPNYL